jgi:CRP-like cAMP-binding protein
MIPVEEMERVEFVRGLGQSYLNQIARMAQLEECPEETVLFQEGQDSPFLYFVLSGQIGLEVHMPEGKLIQVATAYPGELLGWSPALERRSMTATARTKTRSRLAVLNVPQVMALCEKDPRFAIAFFRQVAKALSDRLYATRRYLGRVLCHMSPTTIVSEGSD